MKITAITKQVRNSGRYNVSVDGKYAFSVGEGELLEYKIHTGMELTGSDLASLKESAEIGKIYQRLLNLLSYRPRSEWELRDYMQRKKIDASLTHQLLNKLREHHYIDDRKFATRWVESRRLLKPVSNRKLRQQLAQKRIAKDIIDEVLVVDGQHEYHALQALVERKKDKYPDKLKFMAYLARQGFNYSDIKAVLDEED